MDTDPHPGLKLFDNARAYAKAVKLLNTKPTTKYKPVYAHLSQSAAVYAGLAIDYYLKTLYYLQFKRGYNEYGKTPHDFSSIYKQLKHKTRKELEIRFTTLLAEQTIPDSRIPCDLKGVLSLWTDVFAHLRVNPVQFTGSRLIFFQEMEKVFKTRILEEKPEWGVASAHPYDGFERL